MDAGIIRTSLSPCYEHILTLLKIKFKSPNKWTIPLNQDRRRTSERKWEYEREIEAADECLRWESGFSDSSAAYISHSDPFVLPEVPPSLPAFSGLVYFRETDQVGTANRFSLFVDNHHGTSHVTATVYDCAPSPGFDYMLLAWKRVSEVGGRPAPCARRRRTKCSLPVIPEK